MDTLGAVLVMRKEDRSRPEAVTQRYENLPFGKAAKASLPLMYYHAEVR
jgi:hypothetical protein